MNIFLWIGVVALVVVILLLVQRRESATSIIRYQMIGMLWDERERLRGAIAQHKLTHWEKTVLEDRLKQINDDLAALGVPRESLQ